jgi:hypothetical protein
MPFAPGQSGNPNGRPKRDKIWREAIIRALKRREQDDPQALERLANSFIRKVEEGDVSAIKEFGDRLDGKPAQAVIGDDSEDPITVRQIITGVPRAGD